MNLTFTGEFGSMAFEQVGNTRYMTLPTETAVRIFKSIAVKYPDIAGNEMGLYSFASIGRAREAKFMSLGTPSHLLKKGSAGCTWNPKTGKMTSEITKITLCPVEYQGEECPDAFWGDCLETILGVGNEVNDIFATAEGRQMMAMMMEQLYLGIGNSFYELAWFGQHPIIDLADAGSWYTVTESEWADYKSQQEACVGFMTMIDHYKDIEGLPNFNIPIYESDVNGAKYVGDAIALINRLTGGGSGKFAQMLRQKASYGQNPIIQVTNGVFDRLREQLTSAFGQIPAAYNFYITGRQAVQNCPNGDCMVLAPNALMYNGYIIYNNYALGMFDDITGVISHRAILSAAGVFGLAYDVPSLEQFNGMGMQVVQYKDAPYLGKTYMNTRFEIGTAILNTEFITSASLLLSPA